jgi:DNA polymerase-1
MAEKKLFLLDAFALIYRAYFAYAKNPITNSKGQNTSATMGFVNTLLEVLNKEKPTHIAVVFDTAAPTERHIEFTEYKAHRDAMPEDIASNLKWIRQFINAMNIPILEKDGFEADDVIGTLAKMAEKEGFQTYMMTPDKDYAQLVSENIFMYKPGRGGKPVEIWGVPEILEKFEIKRVEQVIDYLGMMGDAADNIPGLPGVGDKTARKLLAEYDSLENLLEHADEIKGKLGEKIRDNKDKGLLSKKLATIILDVPVVFDANDLKMCPSNQDALKEILLELEFRTIAKRLLGVEVNATPSAATDSSTTSNSPQTSLFGDVEEGDGYASAFESISTVEHTYKLIDTLEKRKKLAQTLSKKKSFCFDTETTGLDTKSAELVGISFSFKAHEAYYVPVPPNEAGAKFILADFAPLFMDEGIEKVAQNIKYDQAILDRYGLSISGPIFDTMLAHYLINADMRHNMEVLAETYLNYAPVPIESLIGKKGKNQKSMRDIPLEEVVEYAAEDADITWQLKEKFVPMLEEIGATELYQNIELPLVSVLAAMEKQGIKLDKESLKKQSEEITKDLIQAEAKIKELSGVQDFNVASPKQLGEVLFDHMQLDAKAKKTKTGQYSTSEDTLVKLKGKHEIIDQILAFRSLSKLKSTYVDALPELVDEKTGRIHTSYSQTVAATGRLSSVNPNLQNIPIRTKRGQEVRKAFVPADENHVLLAADYSQIELRIIAALSGDENMMEAFVNGLDIHASTAAKVFNVPLEDVDREMRGKAKAVNFGIIYGQSAFGLAQNLNISRTEAKEIIESYNAQFPKLKGYMEGNIAFAREHGFVETIMKRKRYLKDINSRNAIVRGHAERNAINAPIQGSAADVIKLAMINVHRIFKEHNFKSKMLLQVHDELVFDAHKDEIETIKPLIIKAMESAVKLAVPLDVEVGIGENWLEAH